MSLIQQWAHGPSHRRPVIQSGFRSTYPTYPLIHVDAVNDAISKAPKAQDIDPIIYVPSLTLGEPPSACCHVLCNDTRLLCVISGNGTFSIVLPMAFRMHWITSGPTLCIRFCPDIHRHSTRILWSRVRSNCEGEFRPCISGMRPILSDTAPRLTDCKLLEETLDSGGYPLTTSLSALRDIVLPPSLFNKLLSVAGANFNSKINPTSPSSGAFSSPIPWRKAGLRYTSNEIYIDLIEELTAVVNKYVAALCTRAQADELQGMVLFYLALWWGRWTQIHDFQVCKKSVFSSVTLVSNESYAGIPDCLLSFTNPSGLVDCAFHPCVRYISSRKK